MTSALLLVLYALAVALLAPPLLARHWPADRAPRLTVALLQILTCSFLLAAVGAGLALAFTLVEGLSELSPTLDSCADQLPVTDHGSLGTALGHLGWISAVLLSARLLYCLAATFGTARRRRRAHSRMLRILATRDDELGVLVLDHPAPACYCLPGDVVITTGALERLSAKQLEAVLLHERAHLSGRHHLIIALATAIRRTIPHIRLLAYAERETRRVVELIADDAAVAHTGAPTVAAALAVIGTAHHPMDHAGHTDHADHAPGYDPVPETALAIDSSPTLRRIRRLLRLDRTLTRRGHALVIAATTAATVLPVALLAVSGAAILRPCPPDSDGGWAPAVVVSVDAAEGS
ncbi:Zn-dependent protease with chaperone function [Catenulispora sp. GP43]|uniref:M56 family metallopeptidase n=1 Tax=Catenulispora sp. GP43 TaxID=3156263 RepID=UPI003516C815